MQSRLGLLRLWSFLKLLLRAAVWRSTPTPTLLGLPALIVCTLLSLIVQLADQYLTAGQDARFTPYGLNTLLADTLVLFVVAACFIRPPHRTTFLCALQGIGVLYQSADVTLRLGLRSIGLDLKPETFWSSKPAILIFLIFLAWWLGAASAILRSIEPDRRWAVPRAVALWLVAILAFSAMPIVPVFRGSDFDIRRANLWEYVSAYRDGRFNNQAEKPPQRVVSRRQVELLQASLLDTQTTQLSARVDGKTNIYTIGMAGSATEGVFVNELNGGLASLARVLPVEHRIVRLINDFDTIESMPVASRQNFAAAVHAIAQRMDRDEDVLLLFMTSHGSEHGVALSLPNAVSADLSPKDVAKVFEREHIQNRIVIVSACFAGIFLQPLADEHTIVLTAADPSHPSFGCSDEREWTYFGDAFFNRSLHPGVNLEEAFLNAKTTIEQWEARDKIIPSNPQGYFGAALMKKLTPLYLTTVRGPS